MENGKINNDITKKMLLEYHLLGSNALISVPLLLRLLDLFFDIFRYSKTTFSNEGLG